MPILFAEGGCGCLIFVVALSFLAKALLPSVFLLVLLLAAASLIAGLFGGSSGGR